MLASVSIELVVGFVLALALRARVPGKPVMLTLLLVPMMLCPVVLSLFWNLILNGSYGVLNQLLASLRLPEPQWLTDNDLKFASILLVDIWMWTPFMMLISLAGLNAILTEEYLGSACHVHLETVVGRLIMRTARPLSRGRGSSLRVRLDTAQLCVFDPSGEPRR